ncbi:hypothetical protein [Sphingobacterium multivorum]|uniref:hypothetical protein n=1 Tax=Sphingobacterium multivorum TaxID=28454 RepID=UPI0028B20D85|nr:hypothetical protein [Sphingobacterium multivorum]
MSYPYIHLSIYTAHFITGNTANPFAIYSDVPIYSCHVMNRSMNRKGAGCPSGGSAMIAFWRAIMTMKTSKTGVATARHILTFCKKQVCVFVTQKLPLCLSAGANLLPAPGGRMEAQDAVPAS